MPFSALRTRLATAPNQIAFFAALRGTIATVLPLVILPLLGVGPSARFVVIGAMNTALVDAGGPYRNRLLAMAASAFIGPLLMLLGMRTNQLWWLAGLAILAIALASGLVRALGPGGIALGLNSAVAFLIGLQITGTGAEELLWTAAYVGGGTWTLLITVGFWQLRPYRRLEQEVAGVWEAVSALVAAANRAPADASGVVARRRQEQRIDARHRATRAAVEQARSVLGEARAETYGPGTLIAQLLVLLRSASRIDAAIVTLEEATQAASRADSAADETLAEAIDELERACRAVARLLLLGRGAVDFTAMRQRLAALTAGAEETAGEGAAARLTQRLALAQAVRQLNNAEEATQQLFGRGRRLPSLRPPPLTGATAQDALASLRAQLTFKSAIFRHGLRVAVVASAGTMAIVRWQVPHGFWLPMTSLIILQPNFGGTQSRAVQRTLGTLAGAVLAGVLLSFLHATAAFEIAIAFLLFAMFLLLRRHYGLAVTFLTPLIILLLGLGGPSPWGDLLNRIIDTLGGAALAVIAGYLLWPLWERDQLPNRLARAILADKRYAGAVLDALSTPAPPGQSVTEARIAAEVETANAEAAFQRMLAEPRHQRGPVAQSFTLVTYVQRLARHSLALAGHLGSLAVPPTDALPLLRQRMEGTLADIAAALTDGRPPGPYPPLDEPLERLRKILTEVNEEAGASIAFLLGQMVSDTTSLHAAATARISA